MIRRATRTALRRSLAVVGALVSSSLTLVIPANAQVIIQGDCNIIFDRVEARQVALTSCARRDEKLGQIMKLLNQIIKDERVEIATVETFITNMNGFIARSEASSRKQENALYYLTDRFSKLEDFLILLVQSPEDAGQAAILLDENLSHTQRKGPLVVQVINFREYKATNDEFFKRLTIRIALTDPKHFELAIVEDYASGGSRISGWRIMGGEGSSCFSYSRGEGLNIHMARSVDGLKPSAIDHVFDPKTISVSFKCPFNFREAKKDIELSFFVRPVADKSDSAIEAQPGQWERIDFKFAQMEYQTVR